MEKYNMYDVLSLEELYHVIAAWDDRPVNRNLYTDSLEVVCQCGGHNLEKRGFNCNASGKFQRYQCQDCGAWTHDKVNLRSKEKTKTLRRSSSNQ